MDNDKKNHESDQLIFEHDDPLMANVETLQMKMGLAIPFAQVLAQG